PNGDPVDGRYSERFFNAEAALVGRLQHPNVVQIFDAVTDPLESYIVMEYVAGNTLRPYCRADQLLSLELIVEIGFKCAMALGAVLYHLIAGRPPFDAQVQSAMMNQIYNTLPISLTGLRSGLAPAVDAVIQRSLAKNPSQRHASWDEFAQDLSSLIVNHEVP